MGGAVSAGEDNDDLVENLVKANYIRSTRLIEIFRAVDRGHYYLKGQRNSAYHDIAWKFNHLHLSAPCIYSEVMEHLDLKPGMSFLNLGSGTGYLSTMAGLVLGSYGINHGIEVHGDVVEYAQEKLKEFVKKSQSFDRFEFCHPQFEVGNCLLLPPDTPGYDRVYCGAACPPEYASYLMNLLKIGGKLVLPLEDQLQVKTRTGEQEWESESALSVSFAHLIIPDTANNNTKSTAIPPRNVLRLQELCRFCIRRVIRDKFKVEMPPKRKRKRRERHQSYGDGMEERPGIYLRRRRVNTTTETTSARRRRMNTSGESDHNDSDSVDSSLDSGESEHEEDNEAMQSSAFDLLDWKPGTNNTAQQNDGNSSTSDIKSKSPNQDLANGANDISLSDNDKDEETSQKPESHSNEDSTPMQEDVKTSPTEDTSKIVSPENSQCGDSVDTNLAEEGDDAHAVMPVTVNNPSEMERTDIACGDNTTKPAETSPHDVDVAAADALPNCENNGRSADTGASTHAHRRSHLRILRNIRHRLSTEGRDSHANSERSSGTDAQEHTDEQGENPERRVVRPSRIAYALLRGLRRRIYHREEGGRSLHEIMHDPEVSEGGQSDHGSQEEAESTDEDLDSSAEEIFKPLAETPFTIGIRRLPLPPKLISYLLYYRQ